ncbi:MAG: hypothetical protein IJ518_03825 [Clostridia bacterium]|nr:hypothetical protein [Clostridia bacterium]
MTYDVVLKRYMITDIIIIVIYIALLPVAYYFLKKLLFEQDTVTQLVKNILCVFLAVVSLILIGLTSYEIYNIQTDLNQKTFLSDTGSFTTDRDRMYFTNQNGDNLILKIRPIIPQNESSAHAKIVYSKYSQILLDVEE